MKFVALFMYRFIHWCDGLTMKPPAVPEADFASVYGELLIKTSPEAERLIGWRRAT